MAGRFRGAATCVNVTGNLAQVGWVVEKSEIPGYVVGGNANAWVRDSGEPGDGDGWTTDPEGSACDVAIDPDFSLDHGNFQVFDGA